MALRQLRAQSVIAQWGLCKLWKCLDPKTKHIWIRPHIFPLIYKNALTTICESIFAKYLNAPGNCTSFGGTITPSPCNSHERTRDTGLLNQSQGRSTAVGGAGLQDTDECQETEAHQPSGSLKTLTIPSICVTYSGLEMLQTVVSFLKKGWDEMSQIMHNKL